MRVFRVAIISLVVASLVLSTSLVARRPGLARDRHLRRTVEEESNLEVSFQLKELYQGPDFFNHWEFFTSPDPTHGLVRFLPRDEAFQRRLAYTEGQMVVLAVDDFSDVLVDGKRDSVRIQTKKNFTGGLFIADFQKMPHGCSVWPAWWSVGPNWPIGGEIDVVEGVHHGPTNRYTLHSTTGCTIEEVDGLESTVQAISHDCDSSGGSNRGCSFADTDLNSYGHNFNIRNGGVFAHLWDDAGITVWRFERGMVPDDLTRRMPKPETWGRPTAIFPSTNCNTTQHFFEHVLVLDITLCGDLGEPTFATSGCQGTCAATVADKNNFTFAKWYINYIAVYDS